MCKFNQKHREAQSTNRLYKGTQVPSEKIKFKPENSSRITSKLCKVAYAGDN